MLRDVLKEKFSVLINLNSTKGLESNMGEPVRLSVAHVSLSRGYKGNERQIELLIKELANIGVPQFLICRDDSPLPGMLESVKSLRIMKISGLSDPRFTGHFRLAKECTIIHAHEPHAVRWAFVHYIMYGVPYIYTFRGTQPLKINFFNRSMFNSTARFVSVSSAIKANLGSDFASKSDLVCESASHYRPNPNNVRRIREAFKGRFLVCQIAPLVTRDKGQSVLIDAARLLKTKIPELVVLLVGSGDDANHLKKHADGLPNIKFLGFKRNYIDYLAATDIFVYPANVEPLGGIFLDCMEQGTPIIASNVGAIKDIVRDHDNGLLINPGDAETLAAYILRLKRDSDLRKRLINSGYNEAEIHNSAAMAAEYYRIYFSVLNGRD